MMRLIIEENDDFIKETVYFNVADNVKLSGWIYIPNNKKEKFPAISMAHGFGATKYHGLNHLASLLAKAGFIVLVHDHRGFGDSEGSLRQEVNPFQQINDWRIALSFLEHHERVDNNRIGIWGSSFAGGEVIILAATDRRVKAVVAQVPTLNGYQSGLRRVKAENMSNLYDSFEKSDNQVRLGEKPIYQPIASKDNNACYGMDEAIAFYNQPITKTKWTNEVTVSSTRWAKMFMPINWISQVAPIPLLMVVAKHDYVAPTDLALEGFNKAHEPKKLFIFDGTHFDPYEHKLPEVAPVTIDWFLSHLK